MTSMQRLASVGLRALRLFMSGTIVVLFAVMAFSVLGEVVGRHFFRSSHAALSEIAVYSLIWLSLVGGGVAMQRNQHIGIDVLIVLCPKVVQQVVVLISAIIAVWFLWVVFDGGLTLIARGAMQRSPAMQIPMSYIYLAIPIGAAYFALELILSSVARLTGKATSQETEL
jgi:TRAP-type C4-dicarboxylate transport system, small permease component